MRLRLAALLLATSSFTGWAKPPEPMAAVPQTAVSVRHGLHSPWDARQVAPSQAAYPCGEPVQVEPTISILNMNYLSTSVPASNAVKDAAYAESAEAVARLASSVVRAADAYQETGSLPAAGCVATILAMAADDHSMTGWMASRDVVYEVAKGMRAMSVGYLKVRNSGVVPQVQDAEILAWMEDVAHKLRTYYEHPDCTSGVCDEYNRRALSAAVAIASVGIATNDRGLFNWSAAKYREAVSRIDEMGMLKEDCVGQWTLRFHLESVAALVQMAEYGELNGLPLYRYDHDRIHALVHTTTRGLVDPSLFVGRVHQKQTVPKTIEGWEIGWATLYVRRFPDSVIEGLLKQSNDAGLNAWAGEPFGTDSANSTPAADFAEPAAPPVTPAPDAAMPAAAGPKAPPPRRGLLSPWDMREIAPTQVAYLCAEPTEVAPTITILDRNYKANSAMSQEVLDAAFADSSTAVTQLAMRVVRAADAYQESGSLVAAQCAAKFLATAAVDHAMAGWMTSQDAVYGQTQGLRSLAVGYLKIRNSGVIQPDQDALILAWLVDIANKQRSYVDGLVCRNPEKICGRFNQRGASVGWAVASVGIAANNPGMFAWGLSRYREAVAHIDQAGMVMQCAHGQYLLKFNVEVVAALVPLAEYGELNGESMYAYQHGRVHELIHAVTRGLVDPTPFEKKTGSKQSLPSTFEGWEISWATVYVRRFPDNVIEGLLQQARYKGLDAWGGQPIGVEPGT